jgi:hypothetical protein
MSTSEFETPVAPENSDGVVVVPASLDSTRDTLTEHGIAVRHGPPPQTLTVLERDLMEMEAQVQAARRLTCRVGKDLEASVCKAKAGLVVGTGGRLEEPIAQNRNRPLLFVVPGAALPGDSRAHRAHEEEVLREGVRLVRDRVLARSSDGGTHLWSRWRRQAGRGEGSSGLAFDVAEPQG